MSSKYSFSNWVSRKIKHCHYNVDGLGVDIKELTNLCLMVKCVVKTFWEIYESVLRIMLSIEKKYAAIIESNV